MSIAESIRTFLSQKKRALSRLAEIAGDLEALAANLTRHSEMCSFPNLKTGLEQLAAEENKQVEAMRHLLLENGVRPKPPSRPPHDGSNNWERLRNDLALQIRILRALRSQIWEWTGADAQMAEQVRQCASEEELRAEQLRDLTLRCDPQALD